MMSELAPGPALNFKGSSGFDVVHPAEGTRAWKLQRPSVRAIAVQTLAAASASGKLATALARIIHSGGYLP